MRKCVSSAVPLDLHAWLKNQPEPTISKTVLHAIQFYRQHVENTVVHPYAHVYAADAKCWICGARIKHGEAWSRQWAMTSHLECANEFDSYAAMRQHKPLNGAPYHEHPKWPVSQCKLEFGSGVVYPEKKNA